MSTSSVYQQRQQRRDDRIRQGVRHADQIYGPDYGEVLPVNTANFWRNYVIGDNATVTIHVSIFR